MGHSWTTTKHIKIVGSTRLYYVGYSRNDKKLKIPPRQFLKILTKFVEPIQKNIQKFKI
jgi:hypothetical protein